MIGIVAAVVARTVAAVVALIRLVAAVVARTVTAVVALIRLIATVVARTVAGIISLIGIVAAVVARAIASISFVLGLVCGHIVTRTTLRVLLVKHIDFDRHIADHQQPTLTLIEVLDSSLDRLAFVHVRTYYLAARPDEQQATRVDSKLEVDQVKQTRV